MAAEYARARTPYPDVVFETLEQMGVIGPGRRVLEVGAGAGLATKPMLDRGSEVVALEPGRRLASILAEVAPRADVVVAGLEGAELADDDFDSAVAATAMHWVDLSVGLPALRERPVGCARIPARPLDAREPARPVRPARSECRRLEARSVAAPCSWSQS